MTASAAAAAAIASPADTARRRRRSARRRRWPPRPMRTGAKAGTAHGGGVEGKVSEVNDDEVSDTATTA
ncbi:hypothetical protein ACFU99_12485 [Streptomyces sp. NPDC057654]|uniref:hypothetical protein n=1 Tax=Streptomyces sp. NPDC057654 TaxID=3346196 RepID=UPI0036AA4C33